MQNDGGGCGFLFKDAEIYLVNAKNSTNSEGVRGLWTYQCSGNKPLEYADDSLLLLRNSLLGTMIIGEVKDVSEKRTKNFSVESIKIKAQQINNKKQVFYGITNQRGFFEIKVPLGTYLVLPELPKGFIFGELNSKENKPIKVEKQKCNGKFFLFKNSTN